MFHIFLHSFVFVSVAGTPGTPSGFRRARPRRPWQLSAHGIFSPLEPLFLYSVSSLSHTASRRLAACAVRPRPSLTASCALPGRSASLTAAPGGSPLAESPCLGCPNFPPPPGLSFPISCPRRAQFAPPPCSVQASPSRLRLVLACVLVAPCRHTMNGMNGNHKAVCATERGEAERERQRARRPVILSIIRLHSSISMHLVLSRSLWHQDQTIAMSTSTTMIQQNRLTTMAQQSCPRFDTRVRAHHFQGTTGMRRLP
jgi:hypothetical protein